MPNVNFVKESQKLEQNPWFYLLEIHLDPTQTVFLNDSEKDVVFDGQTYSAFDFQIGDLVKNAKGEISATPLFLASPNNVFQDYVEQFNGLEGKSCIIRIVNENTLSEIDAKVEFFFRISSVQSLPAGVSLTLDTRLDELFVKVPQRRILKFRCGNVYKGEGCFFRQTQDPNTYASPSGFITVTSDDPTGGTCSKILDDAGNGCEAHNNKPRFGAFPGVSDSRVPLRIV